MSSSPFGELPVVPVPAVYIDHIMPALTDVEWRVLLVVIRQTLGWVEEGTQVRKGRDWLSHSQLKARTGKGGDAISRSIDSLVQYGLIVVEREDGRVVTSPQERRRVRHRLYYRLGQLPHPIGQQEGSTEPLEGQE
jgi:hypothetical protein